MATINVSDYGTHDGVTQADVVLAIAAASDGDTVQMSSGSATWPTTLGITKHISLIGNGEGNTIITENLPRPGVTGSKFLINVDLTHDMTAPAYSFRLSGFTFLSTVTSPGLNSVNVLADLFKFTGLSGIGTSPYVLGCVSRVRIDHCTFTNIYSAPLFLIDSILGVGDHLTVVAPNDVSTAVTKVYMNNWTPSVYDKNGTIPPVTMTTLAKTAHGVRADDVYFGTDKFWFWEDCNFSFKNTTNCSDNERGARVVFRHCTLTGGSLASHGMEGIVSGGLRALETYNNNFIFTSSRAFAQLRSGTILWFNNQSTGAQAASGIPFKDFRKSAYQNNWGAADGTCRYDNNGTLLYSGVVSATTGRDSITVADQANFNLINLTDGTMYSVSDLDHPQNTGYGGPPETADPGWKYRHASITSVVGLTLNLDGDSDVNGSPLWVVGHHYEIRRVNATWGQIGRGKCNLLNNGTNNKGGYETYDWPATSGTKAVDPCAGYDLEPCYNWNNYNVSSSSYLNFMPGLSTAILEGRDYFNLGTLTETTQDVGYPAVSYTHATAAYPDIGPNSDVPYTPFIYPHPLTGAATGKIINVPTSHDFGNVIVGETGTYDIPVQNTGDTILSVTSVSAPTGYVVATPHNFTVAAGATVNKLATFTPVAATTYTGDIVFTSDGDIITAGNDTMAVTGAGVTAGGGGGGKGHKKGVLVQRGR